MVDASPVSSAATAADSTLPSPEAHRQYLKERPRYIYVVTTPIQYSVLVARCIGTVFTLVESLSLHHLYIRVPLKHHFNLE